MPPARLIIDPPATGAWNMAVDEVLLLDAAEQGLATLRFYQWSEPTLSLGYFQQYEDRQQHAASRDCAAVRRQTGGGAILHDRELTYSVILPASHPLARQSERLYKAVHDAFIAALSTLQSGLGDSAWRLSRRDQLSPLTGPEMFLCFERQAIGDVLLTSARGRGPSWKVLGSAQRRHRGSVLQHGSLLLQSSPAARELSGLNDLTGRSLKVEEIQAAAMPHLATAFQVEFAPSSLSCRLESNGHALANKKYGLPHWTRRR